MMATADRQHRRANPVKGFPSLAAFISSDVDKSTLIFNRFDTLAARNLLYMQEELAELQAELDAYDTSDGSDPVSKKAARNWKEFKRKGDVQPRRLELVKDIRVLMKEYREALLNERRFAAIPPPDKRTFKAFREELFYFDTASNSSLCVIGGHSKNLYNETNELAALRVQEQQDRLSQFVEDHLGYFFQEKSKPNSYAAGITSDISYISGRSISSFISYLSTLLAAILLIGAIIVLYKVTEPNKKLGLLAIFTCLFAISVGLLTNARRAEVFGATAAYAAVLVVFVSGNLGGSPG
ncbi:hypothetical protein BKA67DRAFT_693088 [Truncatella angustata]|uniref:DUF6594 domain-containing protein n=1 Tax=Truncatella angustata TaxID=152316 RepID=A0A9P8UGR6_9PEZI|nr:uncharacterized protein BKA67DRAFT_693088 [Truncatella angustata]KAH6651846.1 hypothetical protein BKA67DRAFT_693088 [Truncatella angustata]